MATDYILVDRKILDENSLNCKEKFALVILQDTAEISYSDLAQKMGVTKPTAVTIIKNLEKKGFLTYISKLHRNTGRSATNKYFVAI